MRHGFALLLFIAMPLVATLPLTQLQAYGLSSMNCQPGMQNTYPTSATAGRVIVITTSITNACVVDYNRVLVNILLANTSRILSASIASPAINKVRAPDMSGPWRLVVQAQFIYYPEGGMLSLFQENITINVHKT